MAAARANVDVSRSVTINETFLGQYVAFGTQASQLKVDRPGGASQDCTLTRAASPASTRAGPGPGRTRSARRAPAAVPRVCRGAFGGHLDLGRNPRSGGELRTYRNAAFVVSQLSSGLGMGYRTIAHLLALAAAVLVVAVAPSVAYERPGRTERISSVTASGEESFGMSRYPDISADGRYVAFETSSKLVAGDTNQSADAYVYDRLERDMVRASIADDAEEPDDTVTNVQISGDGRFVAFTSRATNLVARDRNRLGDLFVRDLQNGTTQLVSVSTDGQQTDGEAQNAPSLSDDGRYIVWSTMAKNLVPGDTNNANDVFLRDQAAATTQRVSVSAAGAQGDAGSGIPSISADGRYVAFSSAASNLGPGRSSSNPALGGVVIKDLQTGVVEVVSVSTDGVVGNNSSMAPDVSADGQRVAFLSAASDLVPNDSNEQYDVFVRDRSARTTTRVSVGDDGSERKRAITAPVLSADGRYVAFMDGTLNALGGFSSPMDTVVHDLETHSTDVASVTYDGVAHNEFASAPAISADGRYVTFESGIPNLVPKDFNGNLDVFVRDRGPALGVDNVTAVTTANGLDVTGDAFFSGGRLVSQADATADGVNGAAAAGAEITGFDITYQAELEALRFRFSLASLPTVAAGPARAGSGTVYAAAFTVGSQRYEIRGARLGPAATFALYTCTAVCAHTRELGGGHGSTGREVTIGVPLSAIGASDGSVLRAVAASTWLGAMSGAAVQTYDQASVADVTIPTRSVRLALTTRGVAPPADAFSAAANRSAGRWTGSVPGLVPEPRDLHAQACLGATCTITTIPVGGA